MSWLRGLNTTIGMPTPLNGPGPTRGCVPGMLNMPAEFSVSFRANDTIETLFEDAAYVPSRHVIIFARAALPGGGSGHRPADRFKVILDTGILRGGEIPNAGAL